MTKIERLQKIRYDLNLWISRTFTEKECQKINELIEVELLLEKESNR